jgi:hypothetical protein
MLLLILTSKGRLDAEWHDSIHHCTTIEPIRPSCKPALSHFYYYYHHQQQDLEGWCAHTLIHSSFKKTCKAAHVILQHTRHEVGIGMGTDTLLQYAVVATMLNRRCHLHLHLLVLRVAVAQKKKKKKTSMSPV